MKIETELKFCISKVLLELYQHHCSPDSIRLEATNPDFEGDYTFVVFPYLRYSGKNPEETANEIGKLVCESIEAIDNYNVVKGFLNFELSEEFWIETFRKLNHTQKRILNSRVMLEYSSPNTNKPLHLGHIRNILLGYSVGSILEQAGCTVVKSNLINDRGIHICKSMLAWIKSGKNETPENTGIKGDHLVGKYYVEFDRLYKAQIADMIAKGVNADEAEKKAPILLEAQEMLRKWESGDKDTLDLWEKMNAWVYSGFDITYKRLGIEFDQYYYESNTYLLGKDIIKEGLKKGVFFKKSDGSVWIDLKEEGLDEKLVLRSDGTSVYITQDIGTAQLKYDEFNCDISIYVVGNEQDYHFKVLFLILKKLGKEWSKGLKHLSYGMVDLPSGKMKSREGTVVDADELMDEMLEAAREKTEELGKTDNMDAEEKKRLYNILGLGALKFFMLKVDPQKRMLFDPKESIDLQGDTGPFVQYTYARISSILRAAGKDELESEITIEDLHDSELALIKTLSQYENELQKAAESYSPAIITNYSLLLAKAFNRLYNDVSILKEPDESKRRFRISLSFKTANTIKVCLGMLGIECPERM